MNVKPPPSHTGPADPAGLAFRRTRSQIHPSRRRQADQHPLRPSRSTKLYRRRTGTLTQAFDPVGAVEAVERISHHVSVMAFDNGSCLHPCEPGPDAARDFLARHPYRDLYFVVAGLNGPLVLGKPRKSDMRGSSVVWVDLDPSKGIIDPGELELWRTEKLNELDRSGRPQAHIVISPGRGLWCFWHLSRM